MEVDTGPYEREHGQKPIWRRFWRFTLASSTITAKDHFLDMQEAMPYQKALERALEVAKLRRAEKVIVEP